AVGTHSARAHQEHERGLAGGSDPAEMIESVLLDEVQSLPSVAGFISECQERPVAIHEKERFFPFFYSQRIGPERSSRYAETQPARLLPLAQEKGKGRHA